MSNEIDAVGPERTDWRLVVTDDGDVEARRTVPYDGVRRLSTEDRRYVSYRSNSLFNLTPRQVVKHYCGTADTDRDFNDLVDDVQVALAEVGY